MRFSRDKELNAWYTTMLNHMQKLAIQVTITVQHLCHTSRRRPFQSSNPGISITLFRYRPFSTLTRDLFLITILSPSLHRPRLVSSIVPFDIREPLHTST